MTKIEFVSGTDGIFKVPELAKAAGLCRRFAVIQHTYRSDTVDMYFDELLWKRLIECVSHLGGTNLDVQVVKCEGDVEVPLDAFMSAWAELEDLDREPPLFILARKGQELVLCVATEYWTRIGGPQPYADSYTYSIFSRDDVSAKVRKFLADAEASELWDMA